MNTAVYCRISADRVGAGLGVERQRSDCVTFAEGRGWDVVEVYIDNDISAYSGKKRPAYRRLLADIESGRINAIVAWHTDRLHRSPRELEEFIDLCERHQVRVETVKAGELDLQTPAGRAVARTLGAWARYESEHRSERVRRKIVELAERGLQKGGGERPYGYARDRMTVVPEEATNLREAADRVLKGESLRSICIDFNRRGICTTAGGPWATPRLRSVLMAPRTAGFIQHHTAGRHRAQWPAILDEEQHHRLVALFTDPSRRNNPGAPRRYLLSGILRCSECGTKLVGQTRPAEKGRAQYRCPPQEHRGCGRVSISLHLVEPFLVNAVLATLESLQIQSEAPDSEDKADLDAIAADKAQLEELASLYAERAITPQEWLRARAGIEQRIADRNRRIAKQTADHGLRNLTLEAATLRDAWPDLPLERRRSVMAAALDQVVVKRGWKGRPFDPARLVPTWRI